MKKLVLLLSGLWLLVAGAVEAKYVMPKDSLPAKEKQAGRKARYQLRNLDKDGDGKLSLEEFKSRKLSREDRRIIRRQKKEGTYKSPEEMFREIDVDGTGYIDAGQMADFYAGKKPEPKAKPVETPTEDNGTAGEKTPAAEAAEGNDAGAGLEAEKNLPDGENLLAN